MDKDRVKGAVDQVVGGAKRQAGKLTGNTGTQVKGAVQQVKGKVESAWGNAKDAARDGNNNSTLPQKTNKGTVRSHHEVVVVKESNRI